jgi:ubiquinone/menaquinone biosynthesis C-methylase UbiE
MTEMNAIGRFFVNRLNGRRDRRRIAWLQTNLPPLGGAICLEIGCGNADFAARFVDGFAPARYVATDLDPRQLEAARRHLGTVYPASVPVALELDEADMLELDFPDRMFDRVFAFVTIHHASPNHHDPTALPLALAELGRVLRPGGALVYEEFIHTERILAWLSEHGYNVAASGRRWNREMVVAVKPAGPVPPPVRAPPASSTPGG